LIRAGPEAYKGLILESVLIPVGTLLFACRPKKSSRSVLLYREVPLAKPNLEPAT
jgi:hypothetical protein